MPKNRQPKNATDVEGLVVTAQQSRFYVDASESPSSKEIDIKDLSISIGGREILAHADLKLHENVHYQLVGRNGVGKSTLLRALAEGRIPGVPWSLSMLLLGQTKLAVNGLDDQLSGMHFHHGTVLERVIKSDTRREQALRELADLSEALDNASDPLAIVRAIRKLKHEHLEQALAEMREIAARRSGARGAKSRKDLIALEEQVAISTSRLQQSDHDVDPATVQNETSAAVDTLAEIQSYLDTVDSSTADIRARAVLRGLGFSQGAIESPFTMLSGGWRTRCELACALIQKVDILLLDECTNFLDLPAVIWLEGYIRSLKTTTVVVITHDRDFADAVADELLVLRECGLQHFRGNLSAYERERRSQTRYLTRMKDAQDLKSKHMEETIEANIRAAKRTGDDKKLKQAASRRKKLDERTGLEVGLRGGRFKLNRDLAGYHNSMRDEIEIPTMDPQVRISIPTTPPPLRFPGALVSLKQVSFTYPGASKTSPLTLRDIDLVIHPSERVGIAGLNGSGKSTLVALIMGTDNCQGGGPNRNENGGLLPSRGTVTRHSRACIRWFSQHAVEELEARGAQDRSITALSELLSIAAGEMTEQEARAILGSLGLSGRIVSDVPVAALSGGQKVRLALAKLIYSPPHLLVLDEVTTHVDSDTVLALVEALREFEGALLVITHDRFFMRCVVEGDSPYDIGEDEEAMEKKGGWQPEPGIVYRLVKGQLELIEGGMRGYEAIASKASAKPVR